MSYALDSGVPASQDRLRALLVESDLFFSARIISVLEKAGHEVKAVGTQQDAEAAFASDPPALMLVNLASEKLGRADLIRRVKAVSPSTKVVAFISHTRIPEFRESVLAAGADKLCANSAISMRLPDIVRSVMAGASGVEEE